MGSATASASARTAGQSFTLLGVRFCTPRVAPDLSQIKAGMATTYDALRPASERAMPRQRRSYVSYWDALTHFEVSAPSGRGRSKEEELALTVALVAEAENLGARARRGAG